MDSKPIHLSVPAEPSFARPVRMLAANLAVLASLSLDETEDLRMAAEEGFVYACSTKPELVDISFLLGDNSVRVEFALGDRAVDDDPSLSYATLLISAVCDSFEVANGRLSLLKTGGRDA